MKPETKYECTSCYDIHDDEWEAQECCPREVNTVYVCAECDEVYLDVQEANECCAYGEEIELVRSSPIDLERAGQQRLF
jgi:hypothetical protein